MIRGKSTKEKIQSKLDGYIERLLDKDELTQDDYAILRSTLIQLEIKEAREEFSSEFSASEFSQRAYHRF